MYAPLDVKCTYAAVFIAVRPTNVGVGSLLLTIIIEFTVHGKYSQQMQLVQKCKTFWGEHEYAEDEVIFWENTME